METPDQIKKHQPAFNADAWKQYSFDELCNWVHLLSKRARHRVAGDKKNKDLYDASNYLAMAKEHLKANPENWQSHDVTAGIHRLEQLNKVLNAEIEANESKRSLEQSSTPAQPGKPAQPDKPA